MADKIDKQQVEHVASLAKLHFDDQHISGFTDDLSHIMDLFDSLDETDTDNVAPTFSVTDQVDIMRDDVADNWGQRDALLKNAPEVADGLIRVPTIIDESED